MTTTDAIPADVMARAYDALDCLYRWTRGMTQAQKDDNAVAIATIIMADREARAPDGAEAKPVAWLWTNEFGKKVADVFMPSSLNNAAPLYLAHDGVEAGLREALTRIKAATPNNTNSSTAEEMASWTKTVAACALDRHTHPAPSSPDAELLAALKRAKQELLACHAIYGVPASDVAASEIDALLSKHGGKS